MVEDFCNHIHRNLIKDVKYVLVWGTSARHHPQHCGLGHSLHDEDMVQIVKRKVRQTSNWYLGHKYVHCMILYACRILLCQ
jgi:hypothetical protein